MSSTPEPKGKPAATEIDSVKLLESFPKVKVGPRQAVKVRLDFNRLGLRPASEGDYEFFYQLKKDAIGDYVRATWGWDEEQQQDFHFREWHPESLDIITIDIKPIGSMRLRTFSEEVHLGQFYLKPTFQKLGIGSHLLQTAKAQARSAGLPLRIEVLKVNPARAFYERHGFRSLDATRTHYRMEWHGDR